MPPAALAIAPLVGGLAAGAGSAAGGKKGSDVQKQQLALQQANSQYGKNLVGTGMSTAWTPAANYWNTLLKGGQAAVTAVGPYSDMIRNSTAATNTTLQGLPGGGERNLAIAQNQVGQANNLARLYAGVQPTAAQALGTLSQVPIGAGGSIINSSGPQIGAGVQSQLGNQGAKMQGGSGLGSLLYNGMNKNKNASGGAAGGKGGGGGGKSGGGGGSITTNSGWGGT